MFSRSFFSSRFYAGHYFSGTGGAVILTPSVILDAQARALTLNAQTRPLVLLAQAES